MTETQFDSIVLGGGSGGMAFAEEAAGQGARVLVIERDHLGGTCVNQGCVPKKILWSAGRLNRSLAQAHAVHVFNAPQLDFAMLAQRRDHHIKGIRDGIESSFNEKGIALLRGEATTDGKSVTVNGTAYTANNIILATGARPATLDIPGSEHLIDSRDVLAWSDIPASMAIVGAGYIGCEFAAIFRAMGVDVTLIHDGPRVLETFPSALAEYVQAGLRDSGIDVRLNMSVTEVRKVQGQLRYTMSDDGVGTADVVVAAVGRTPNVDNLGPLSEKLALADSGAVAVDERLQTNVPDVYAVGDVADRLPLTPVATTDGTVLARILHGAGDTLLDLDHAATTTFVYPPAAFVGHVGDDPCEATFTPLHDDLLTPDGQHDPALYRIGLDAKGLFTGAEIVADHAEDLIAALAAMRHAGGTARDLDRIIPIHPSFAEEFTGT